MYYGAFCAGRAAGDLAERRRRRRDAAAALLQARATVDRDGDADRAGRRRRVHGDRAEGARQLSRRVPAPAAATRPWRPQRPRRASGSSSSTRSTTRDGSPGRCSGSRSTTRSGSRASPAARSCVRQGGKQSIAAGVTLTRPARVVVSVETAAGVRIAPIALRQVPPGRFRIEWKGTIRRSFVYGGLYTIPLPGRERARRRRADDEAVQGRPRGAGEEEDAAEAARLATTLRRCRSPPSSPRSRSSSRP